MRSANRSQAEQGKVKRSARLLQRKTYHRGSLAYPRPPLGTFNSCGISAMDWRCSPVHKTSILKIDRVDLSLGSTIYKLCAFEWVILTSLCLNST